MKKNVLYILLSVLIITVLVATVTNIWARNNRNRRLSQAPTEKNLRNKALSIDSLLWVIENHAPEESLLLVRKAYITSYNPRTLQPNWVAWILTGDHAFGNLSRSSDFREDEEVGYPRATLQDYRGSGYTRGHMCPAGDNKWDAQAMSETFLLSNMCPQTNRSNSGTWGSIEQACRNWAQKFGKIYIVCGPVFTEGESLQHIGPHKIPVPERFFKVVLCLQRNNPMAIGFICLNHETEKMRVSQYVTTVDEVERLTGMDFFSALPDKLEEKVESTADLYKWNRRW